MPGLLFCQRGARNPNHRCGHQMSFGPVRRTSTLYDDHEQVVDECDHVPVGT